MYCLPILKCYEFKARQGIIQETNRVINIENNHRKEINTRDVSLNSVNEVHLLANSSFSLVAGTNFAENLSELNIGLICKNRICPERGNSMKK